MNTDKIKKFLAFMSCVSYVIVVLIVLPLCIYEKNLDHSTKVEAWFIGGIFVMATLPVAMYGIIKHALHYSKPHLQKYIIRILFMVPIYALNSWIVLKFPQTSIYLDTIRECYEAFSIYNFMMYLINFLKHEVPDFEIIKYSKRNIRWLCCLPPCENGVSVLDKCKFGVLQYTLIRVITSFIAYVSEIFKVYNEGEIDFRFSWSYVAIANNFSQMIAMFCLILLYTVYRKELAPLKPIRQYLCIKFVVFVTFWQSILIAILTKFGIISTDQWPYFPTIIDTVNGLQDFLICVEMFIASIAHIIAFPVSPYLIDERLNWLSNIANAANVSDLSYEVRSHYDHFYGKVKSALRKGRSCETVANSNEDANEYTRLVIDTQESYGIQTQIENDSVDLIVEI